MTKLFYETNIDITDAIKSDFDLSFMGYDQSWLWPFFEDDIKNIFNYEWIEKINALGLEVKEGMIFFKTPSEGVNAHIDGLPRHPFKICHYGLNWNLGLHHVGNKFSRSIYKDNIDDAEMVWFRQTDIPKRKYTSLTPDLRPINYWSADWKSLEDQRMVLKDKVMLVNTSVPHEIIMKNYYRLSISLRNIIPNDNHTLTWEEAVKSLKTFIVD